MILLGMGMLMMYIAAPFEGFFSFNPGVPQWLKAVVGALVFSGWCAYWAFSGRNEPGNPIEGLEMPAEEAMKAPTSSRSSV